MGHGPSLLAPSIRLRPLYPLGIIAGSFSVLGCVGHVHIVCAIFTELPGTVLMARIDGLDYS